MANQKHQKFSCRITTTDENAYLEYRKEIDELKELASGFSSTLIESDADFFEFLKDYFQKKESGKNLTPKQRNISEVASLIQRQMEINETDNDTYTLGSGDNAKQVFINKRYITPAWVQSELGCSFNPIKEFFGTKDNPNEENRKMLDKHHKKCEIDENHNRLIAKALRARAKQVA